MMPGIPPGGVLAPPPMKPRPPVVRRYGHTVCTACGLEAAPASYCRCGAVPLDIASDDGAHSDLTKRIAECEGGR